MTIFTVFIQAFPYCGLDLVMLYNVMGMYCSLGCVQSGSVQSLQGKEDSGSSIVSNLLFLLEH